MRRSLVAMPVLLAACAAQQPRAPAEIEKRTCQADNASQFIGQPRNNETGAAILRATNSATIRWAPPGVMLTMDFNPSRVTVRLGPDGKVTAVNCG